MIATTIEQSKHLQELGLGVDTADMYYKEWERSAKGYDLIAAYELPLSAIYFSYYIPAWSVSALVKLIPEQITIREPFVRDWVSGNFRITQLQKNWFEVGHHWGSRPVSNIGTTYNEDLVTAVYKYVVWLIIHKHIVIKK